MRRGLWIGVVTAVLTVSVCAGAQGGECGYDPVSGLSAGRDASSWYLRCEVQGLTHYQEAVDRLARSGDDLAFYLSGLTPRHIPVREWRAESRKDLVRRFAADTGLAFEIAPDGTWILGPPAMVEEQRVVLFVQNLASKQEFPARMDARAVGRAILASVPVRDGGRQARTKVSGVGYLWLMDEPGTTFLVQTGERSPGTRSSPPIFEAYKVRVRTERGRIVVSCIWQTETIGDVVPSVSEDFNGDSYRDFVFDGSTEEYGESSVISGKDGSRLLAFSGGEFAVRSGARGSATISVEVPSTSPPSGDGHPPLVPHRWSAGEARLVPETSMAGDSVITYWLHSGPRPGSKTGGTVVRPGTKPAWGNDGRTPVAGPGLTILGVFDPEGLEVKRGAGVPTR